MLYTILSFVMPAQHQQIPDARAPHVSFSEQLASGQRMILQADGDFSLTAKHFCVLKGDIRARNIHISAPAIELSGTIYAEQIFINTEVLKNTGNVLGGAAITVYKK